MTARPAERTDVPYVWPRSLLALRPAKPVVYLDLNQWVSLAQANTAHPTGVQHVETLAYLRAVNGRIVIPLTTALHMEVGAITDPKHRFDLADVMEELTGLKCLLSPVTVAALELDAAVAALAGTTPKLGVPLIGTGVVQAMGRQGRLRVHGADGADITESARAWWPDGHERFDEMLRNGELEFHRSVLRGPTDDEAPDLRARGWDPTTMTAQADDRANRELQIAALLAERSDLRRQLRAFLAGVHLAHEVPDTLERAAHDHGVAARSLYASVEEITALVDSMPSADVRVSYLATKHRNPRSEWKRNDIFDIDALSVAVPYCDVVVADADAHHLLHASGAPRRLGATVLRDLPSLVADLRGRLRP